MRDRVHCGRSTHQRHASMINVVRHRIWNRSRQMQRVAAAFALLFACSELLIARQPAQDASWALTHVTVIDATGGPARPDMTVLIRNGRIGALGKYGSIEIPKQAQVVDATGKSLVPGLWDMHVHLSVATQASLPLFLANGITGVRDMGGSLYDVKRWRTRITEGSLRGPHIITSGPYVDGPKLGAPYRVTVKSATQAREAVQKLRQLDVDFIKVHNAIPRDAYFALADAARQAQMPFAGHVPRGVTLTEAADSGQRSIEHTEVLFQTYAERARQLGTTSEATVIQRALAAFTDAEAVAQFRRLAKNGTYYVPTLIAYQAFLSRTDSAASQDPRLKYVAPATKRYWDKWFPVESQPAELVQQRRVLFQRFFRLVRLMQREGVPILAGSDLGERNVYPGFSLHDELSLLVDAGLTPMEALQTATRNAAAYLGRLDTFGTIATGKTADLVLLDANPLEDIRHTRRVHAVIVGGTLLPGPTLRAILADAEAAAKRQ